MSMARSAFPSDPRHIVLMGVSGCGKSSVGAALSAATGLRYQDADDLHPPENVERMRSGQALRDEDRWGWLDRCAGVLRDAPEGLILGRSALRRIYRDRLISGSGCRDLIFVHLTGSETLLRARMQARAGHYMPPSLLQSQLLTLEPPAPDETAFTVSIDQPVAAIAAKIMQSLYQTDAPSRAKEK